MFSVNALERVVRMALEEDCPWGDLTSEALLPPQAQGALVVRFRQPGLLCGLPVAQEVFRQAAPQAVFAALAQEGQALQAGQVAVRVSGPALELLRAERVALNFLQRLSGIATLTARYVAEARKGSPNVRVAATRKTTPGLRALEKYAVQVGGGVGHRFSLSDGVLVKDNHLALLAKSGLSLAQALAQARLRIPHGMKIQVEVDNLEQLEEALAAGAELLLLDNMSLEDTRLAVARTQGRALLEASGNMTLERMAQVAATGVSVISVGALTHTAPSLDIALDFET